MFNIHPPDTSLDVEFARDVPPLCFERDAARVQHADAEIPSQTRNFALREIL
jgi:hypothetical protein